MKWFNGEIRSTCAADCPMIAFIDNELGAALRSPALPEDNDRASQQDAVKEHSERSEILIGACHNRGPFRRSERRLGQTTVTITCASPALSPSHGWEPVLVIRYDDP